MGIRIAGTGRALPGRKVTNGELSTFVDTDDEWIYGKTGISGRYLCSGESQEDLTAQAALNALGKAKLEPGDIDLVMCTTIGGDYVTPALACCVSGRLGIERPAFDVNAACTGFVYALDIAASLVDAGKYARILIISSEMMSRYVDWNDRRTCVLFGDGAAACVVTKGDSLKYIKLTASCNTQVLYLKSKKGNNPFRAIDENDKTPSVYEESFIYMNGQEVYKFAVTACEREITAALETAGLKPEDVKFFLLHQANKRIIDSVRLRMGLGEGRFPVNIGEYSNTSSATIPILLDELLEAGRITAGDIIVLSGFGGGLTTGTCILEWI